MQAFSILKDRLVSAPIVVAPDWDLPFELMCDASDFAIGAVLGQKRERIFQVIHYASRTLNDAQLNYATTEKYLLAIVFAFDKFSVKPEKISFFLKRAKQKFCRNIIG